MKEKKQSYSEKLLDQRWQQKRLELLNSAEWKCQCPYCQNEKEKPTLHVHHKLYLRGKDPWDYEEWAYVVLCDECHGFQQSCMETIHSLIAKHDTLSNSIFWIKNLEFEDQIQLCQALEDLTTLRVEYVKPMIALLQAAAFCQRELVYKTMEVTSHKTQASVKAA